MPFFADETDSRQVVFSLLRRVFACYDPLPGPKFTGGSRLSDRPRCRVFHWVSVVPLMGRVARTRRRLVVHTAPNLGKKFGLVSPSRVLALTMDE